jgi:redox-sensing transcriptional repressor
MPRGVAKKIDRSRASLASLRRLPLYLEICRQAEAEGQSVISGTVIAEELNLDAIQVRKDLSITGVLGKPRIGYGVQDLIQKIDFFLRWDQSHSAALIGVGKLGQALLAYRDLRRYNFNILFGFDNDPQKIGKEFEGVTVYDVALMQEMLKTHQVEIVVIATPDFVALDVASVAYNAGVRKFWNFTPRRFKLPGEVLIYTESLMTGYSVLSVREPSRS